MSRLRPYQAAGAEFLAGRSVALLADDMGLGKTAQAIAACDAIGEMNVLVVCPASVRETWNREFARFSVLGTVPVVVSYEDVLKSKWTIELWTDGALIVDEAHYLKSATSKRTRFIFGEECDGESGLISRADRVILLTGTPMPNHPAELWPALRALAPETITGTSGKPYSYWQFVKKFCKTRDNGFGIQIVGGKNHDELKARLAPFMLRRLKSEVLTELPPIQFDNLYVEGRITGFVDCGEAALIERTLKHEGIEGLKAVAAHVATLRRLTGLAKVAPCADWIADFVESGRKLVVFAHHREVIDELHHAMVRSKIDHVRLTGDTVDRQSVIDHFQKNLDVKVFIGQIQAAGTGITLTAASDVLFVEASWVPSDNSQAAARVHRMGQDRGCIVRFATLSGSIDEQIQRAVLRKTSDIEKIVG